VKVIRFTTGY